MNGTTRAPAPVLPDNATFPGSRARWRAWLQRHHEREQGVWLVMVKAGTGRSRLGYDEAVEEALCFGWIDSKPRVLDADHSMLWFSPRKPGSGWSRPNKERVERAIADGRMAPAGLRKVQAAQHDGSWSRLDAIEDLVVPEDLASALMAHAPAATHFAAFPRSVRRGILEWIAQARREDTRARRVQETAELAARNQRANQWRPREPAVNPAAGSRRPPAGT